MGVHRLWRLLDCFSSETLPDEWRGKCVAVDASVWMAQFQAAASNASSRRRGDGTEDGTVTCLLEGFANRIMKLLFYDITPVFVFDGPASSLKSREVRRRRELRDKQTHDSFVRRAKRIIEAQVACGALTTDVLAALPKSSTLRNDSSRVASPRKQLSSPPTSSPTRKFRIARQLRRGRRAAAIVIAPEAVSRDSTRTFVRESEVLVSSRRQVDALQTSNMLLSSVAGPTSGFRHRSSGSISGGSSLYLGPRSAVEDGDRPAAELPARSSVSLRSADESNPWGAAVDVDEAGSGSSTDLDASGDVAWMSGGRWVCDVEETTRSEPSQASNSDAIDEDESSSESEWERVATAGPISSSTRSSKSLLVSVIESDLDDSSVEMYAVTGEGSTAPRVSSCRTPTVLASSPSAVRGDRNAESISIHPRHQQVDTVPLDLLDVVELLRLFDVRFVVSPGESDAQCAFLNACGAVDAVFTEDSDVVVHQAPVVLRGFFSSKSSVVRQCRLVDLKAAGVSHAVLLALTQLLGCDYCAGTGLSVADAVEVVGLQVFPPEITAADSSHVAVAKALEYLERWLDVLRHGGASEMLDDVALAQRHMMLSCCRTKWSQRWAAGSGLPQPFPDVPALLMFTENVPVNRHITARPANCNPHWDGLRVFLWRRGLGHLWEKVQMLRRERGKERGFAKAAAPNRGFAALEKMSAPSALCQAISLLSQAARPSGT